MDMVNFMSPRLFVTLHFLTFLVTLVPLRQCKQRWYGSSLFELNWQEAAAHIFFIYPDILLWDGKFLGSVGFAHCIHLVKQPRGNIWKAMVPLKTWTNQIFFFQPPTGAKDGTLVNPSPKFHQLPVFFSSFFFLFPLLCKCYNRTAADAACTLTPQAAAFSKVTAITSPPVLSNNTLLLPLPALVTTKGMTTGLSPKRSAKKNDSGPELVKMPSDCMARSLLTSSVRAKHEREHLNRIEMYKT